MAKNKIITNKKSNNKIILLSLLVLVLAAFGMNYYKSKNVELKPNPTQGAEFVDVENDGVYSDYKYNFRFKYPKEVLKYQKNGNTSVLWINEGETIGGLGPTAVSKTAIQLQLSVIDNQGISGADNPKERYVKDFNNLFELANGQKYQDKGLVKLGTFENNEFRRVDMYLKTPPDRGTEHSEYYGAWWLKSGYPVIRMEYFAGSKETLEKFKPEFDQIVQSFGFF